jgi:hypothetical protein
MSNSETESHFGWWWQPGSEANRLAGILSIDSKSRRITLDLLGDFNVTTDDILEEHNAPFLDCKFLQGRTTDGEILTLYECHQLQRGGINAAMSNITSKIQARSVFWKAHFSNEAQLKFQRVQVAVPILSEWTRSHTFKLITKGGVRLVHREPPHILIMKADHVSIHLQFEAHLWGLTNRLAPHASQLSTVVLEFRDQTSYTNILSELECLRDFLSFFTHRFVRFEQIRLWPQATDFGGIAPIEVPDSRFPLLTTEPGSGFLVEFKVLKRRLPQVVTRWWKFRKDYPEVVSLYLKQLYRVDPQTVDSTQTVSFANALEAYHRKRHSGKLMSSASYRNLATELSSVINRKAPKQHRLALARKIEYLNECSLNERLIALLDKVPKGLKGVLFADSFPRELTDFRNYHSHYNERLEERLPKGGEQILLHVRARALIEICIFQEMGVPMARILQAMRQVYSPYLIRPHHEADNAPVLSTTIIS